MNDKQFNIRISDDLLQALKSGARYLGISASDLARIAIERELKKLADYMEKEKTR